MKVIETYRMLSFPFTNETLELSMDSLYEDNTNVLYL
jgi:hypothetical protein